jgi:hypothetical protein
LGHIRTYALQQNSIHYSITASAIWVEGLSAIEALGEGEELEIRRWTARLGDGYQPVYSTDFDAVRLR